MATDNTGQQQAIDLQIDRSANQIRAILSGSSEKDQEVSYELVMRGQSTTRHKGKTTLRANENVVLSKVSMNGNGDDWCVKVKVLEEDGRSYELSEGSCD